MHSYDNTVIRSENDCQIRDLFARCTNQNQIAVVLVLVSKSDYTTKELMGYFNGHPW